MLTTTKKYTFDDVMLVSDFSNVKSRQDCSTNFNVLMEEYEVPIMNANMDTIINENVANGIINAGGMAALHRFMPVGENVELFQKAKSSWVSVGILTNDKERIDALLKVGALKFIIDVAHGASCSTIETINYINAMSDRRPTTMVGNFGSPRSVELFLNSCMIKPDYIKMGVGSGSNCSTSVVTGVGYPQLSLILDTVNIAKKHRVGIVSDGGAKTIGDVCKALAAGADFVMTGSLYAGAKDGPGKEENGYKIYRGSASKESYIDQGKVAEHRVAEGVTRKVKVKEETAYEITKQIQAGIKSSMSYLDAKTLTEYRTNCEFIEVTHHGYIQGTPHGLRQE